MVAVDLVALGVGEAGDLAGLAAGVQAVAGRVEVGRAVVG